MRFLLHNGQCQSHKVEAFDGPRLTFSKLSKVEIMTGYWLMKQKLKAISTGSHLTRKPTAGKERLSQVNH